MGLLERITTAFRGKASPEELARMRVEQEQLQARRQTIFSQMMEEFSDGEHVEPKQYHELSVGEAKSGRTPAIEYFLASSAVRLHHLMLPDQMRAASLIRAYGMRCDDLEDDELSEIVDLKPVDQPGVEHGAVNLGPVPEFKNAKGSMWRFFVELSYSAASTSGRGGILTRHFVVDSEL